MHIRNTPAVVIPSVVLGLLGLGFLVDVFNTAISVPAGARVGFAAAGLVAVGLIVRLLQVGLILEPNQMIVRDLFSTTRVARNDVLGLAVSPVCRGWFRRALLVCADGRVIPATWTVAGVGNLGWDARMTALASGFGPTQAEVPGALEKVGRLDVERRGPSSMLALATREPILSPETVSPVSSPESAKWLGKETIFIVGAMVFPGIAGAVGLLIQHFVTHQGLDEFDLPIKHHFTSSLIVLIISYLGSAVVVPIALLLLARTGQSPSSFGLSLRAFRKDAPGAVGLLAGVYLANLIIIGPLSLAFNSSFLNNGQHDTHVPAYFIVYGLSVSLTTAINEEVIVNGYFMTRLAQLGYAPRAAFAISLATRTSYHVYYGIGFIATVPFGYLVTRSFQKRGKLTRPILAHFIFDAIGFTAAVLSS
jgi:hypothetical protein